MIILNKIDLIKENEITKLMAIVNERIKRIPVIAISNETQKGIEKVKECIEKGKTYCLLGSSGVGKSTLLNTLSGKQVMKTNRISISTNKGRHITSHRELLVLENGGILIDNPGMREIGIADSTDGIETTFETIIELSKNCRFKDCTHTTEKDCAIITALESGEVDKSSYENYLKMERENEYFESTVAEKRKKDKDFGKIIKHYKKTRKTNKY
jgi:ribosome biogenesis GTPase